MWMPCPCGKGNHRSLTLSRVRGGREKFYGRRNALTASAAYLASLGAAIIAAWGQAKRLTSSQTQGTKPRKRSAAEAFHAPQNIGAPKHKGKSRRGSVGAPRQATAATMTGYRSQVWSLLTQLSNPGQTSAPVTAHNPTMLGRITAATATQGEGHRPQVARLWPMLTQPTDPGKTNGPVSAHTRTPWRVH